MREKLDNYIKENHKSFTKWARSIRKKHDKSDIKDIVNDFIVRLYEILDSGKLDESKLNGAYLFGIMRNMMRASCRDNKNSHLVLDFNYLDSSYDGVYNLSYLAPSNDEFYTYKTTTIVLEDESSTDFHEYFYTFYQMELSHLGYTYEQILKLSRIQSHVMEISPDQIELFKDYYVKMLSLSEIGRSRGLPKSRVHQLLVRLNNKLLIASQNELQKIRF